MIEKRKFGDLPDGRAVTLYSIKNSLGEYVELLDFGAAIHSVYVKDAEGHLGDVVLGVNEACELSGRRTFEGITIGRCANRIAFGRFEIDGKVTQLECNSSGHFLHGASGNYAHKMFQTETDEKNNTVSFFFHDTGEGGFDCEADVKVSFTFDDNHRLEIRYEMVADGDTVLCPTNHAYFNLSGDDDVRDHYLRICADQLAPKGEIGMPTGDSMDVKDTPADFRELRLIREAIDSDLDGLYFKKSKAYDDFYILSKKDYGLAAELISPKSGRRMRVYTDMPSVILYTPINLEPKAGKNGRFYDGYCSVCLETQFVPNAVNCPQYLSPVFRKGEKLISKTVYAFDTELFPDK